jgi:hypothetical protein
MTDDLHLLTGAHAVNALDDIERAAFERHLLECEPCRREVAEFREVLAAAAPVVAPPPALRDQVMAEVMSSADVARTAGAEPQPASGQSSPSSRPARPPVARRVWPGWAWTGAAAAAILLVAVVWRPWTTSPQAPVTAAAVIQAADAQRTKATVGEATVTLVRSPSLGRAAIVAEGMPAAAPGTTYEIWFQDDRNAMIPAGFMPPPTSGQPSEVLLTGDATKFVGAGITVEPEGGSSTPTGPPVAVLAFAG